MAMSVSVDGVDDVINRFAQLSEDMAAETLGDALLAGALIIEGNAKELAPVLTGNLSRSIHSALESATATTASVRVGTNVEYAPFVEFGTRFQSAQPYLRPALDGSKAEVQETILLALKQIVMARR